MSGIDASEPRTPRWSVVLPRVAFVFADIRLVGAMDGVDLARSIVTLWPKARVVLTSGAAQERITNLPEGVAYLPKPWRGLEVLVEVERATSKPNPVVR